MPRRWVSKLTGLALWLFVATLAGFVFGCPIPALAVALAAYLGLELRNIYRLDRIISGKKARGPSLATHGFWAELSALVDRVRSKSRARKRRYHRLVREVRESTGALSDAGVILNAATEIIWFNDPAIAMLGLDSNRDIGRRLDNLIRHPEFVGYLEKNEVDAINLPSPTDTNRTLSVQCIPYGLDQRLAIFRDVTHQIQLERTRQDFVANASHELRSPLTVINGYLDTLTDDPDAPSAWQLPIEEMSRQAERMTGILRDLIELTRLDTVDAEAARDIVDIDKLLNSIIAEFEARSAHPGLELEIQSHAALLGAEPELHSIFFNLIANAIRFTGADGSIRVVWRADEYEAVFEVIDSGIGIPEEAIPRLTERFYRVDTSRSRATGGTGLGLAIVKHAVQRHGGELRISSEVGVGSRFACHFGPDRIIAGGRAAGVAV